jgi:seryl-tRNA synthetase
LRYEKHSLSDRLPMNPEILSRSKELKNTITQVETHYAEVEASLLEEALYIPNLTYPGTPIGDESCSNILETIGSCPRFTFTPKDHMDLAKLHDWIDFEKAASVTGSQFYYLRKQAAQMELALAHYAMQKAMADGFTPVIVPDLVRSSVLNACGYRPRGDATQIYALAPPHSELCLVGTAEIPLAGMYMDGLLPKTSLPMYMVAFSHCFRAEAGARGKESKGLFRVHQFSKVELFAITTKDQSDEAFQKIINMQKKIVIDLELHARLLEMPTEELGLSAYRKIDIEAWMPGKGIFGEISSASHCTDFQSRRLNIRYKNEFGENQFVHTLNGTACAIPRTIISIMEQHQQADGSIRLPGMLQSLIGNDRLIGFPRSDSL